MTSLAERQSHLLAIRMIAREEELLIQAIRTYLRMKPDDSLNMEDLIRLSKDGGLVCEMNPDTLTRTYKLDSNAILTLEQTTFECMENRLTTTTPYRIIT